MAGNVIFSSRSDDKDGSMCRIDSDVVNDTDTEQTESYSRPTPSTTTQGSAMHVTALNTETGLGTQRDKLHLIQKSQIVST